MTDELDNAVQPTKMTIPVAADTLAVGEIGKVADDDRVVPRKQVVSWAMWDWATQPFNSVILTFVFASLYLISDKFLPADIAALPDGDAIKERALANLSAGYGLATTLAGVLILLLAPVLGQRADASGSQKRLLLLFTAVLALVQFALFFVFASPEYFWLGAGLLAIGAVDDDTYSGSSPFSGIDDTNLEVSEFDLAQLRIEFGECSTQCAIKGMNRTITFRYREPFFVFDDDFYRCFSDRFLI